MFNTFNFSNFFYLGNINCYGTLVNTSLKDEKADKTAVE